MRKRNYKKEYEDYHAKPEQKKRRAERNSSRRKLQQSGKVTKGDGKDVHHRNHDTSDQSSSNLVAISASKNRSDNQKKENTSMKLKKIIKEQFKYELGKVYPDMRVNAFKPVGEDIKPQIKEVQFGADKEIKTKEHGSVFLDVEESKNGLYILVASAKDKSSLNNKSDVVEIKIDNDGNVKVKQRQTKVNFR